MSTVDYFPSDKAHRPGTRKNGPRHVDHQWFPSHIAKLFQPGIKASRRCLASHFKIDQ
jgi:hypothetical protein